MFLVRSSWWYVIPSKQSGIPYGLGLNPLRYLKAAFVVPLTGNKFASAECHTNTSMEVNATNTTSRRHDCWGRVGLGVESKILRNEVRLVSPAKANLPVGNIKK